MKTKFRSAAVEVFERRVVEQAAPLVEKWADILDAPGAPPIANPVDRAAMAQMLETSSKQLRLMEATQTTSVFGSNYFRALLGMTRQIFPRLLGSEVAAIQPLDRPTGKIFHLNLLRDDSSSAGVQPHLAQNGFNTHLSSRTYADFSGAEGDAITTGMKLSIASTDVDVGTPKKLKVEASLELVQDLEAYHGLNALDLLQGAASDEIAREIDAMIVVAARTAAIAHQTVTFGTTAPNGWSGTQDPWRKRLQRAILKADTKIYVSSGRRSNFIICGPGAHLELSDLNDYTAVPAGEDNEGSYGLKMVGTLAGTHRVFLSQYISDMEMILGRKGMGFLDAGIVYAPYIPLFVSERFFDPTYQKTIQSFASRFCIKTVSNTLFARVIIDENATGIAVS